MKASASFGHIQLEAKLCLPCLMTMENDWCMHLDFMIVVVSLIVLALDSLLPGVQWLKGLRVLRALKPLR